MTTEVCISSKTVKFPTTNDAHFISNSILRVVGLKPQGPKLRLADISNLAR